MKHRAIINISTELLIELLKLNSDIEIVDVRINHFNGGTVDLLLAGKSIPECEEGAYPRAYPLTTYSKEVKI